MAYLNVRERRLEAKIAYVGPAQSGKSTNFVHLGGGSLENDVLGLFWRPKDGVTFRDFAVRVHLVLARGGASTASLLRDVDGVVFVADATAEAQGRNREVLAAVKQALAAASTHAVPIVVQVNKSDHPDALSLEDVAAPLDVAGLPIVSASATRGEGVVETAERALAAVLEVLHTRAPAETMPPPTVIPRDGNPLLTALREILRDTVAQQVAAMESRLEARLDRALDAQTVLAAKLIEQREAIASLDLAMRGLASDVSATVRITREQGTSAAATRKSLDAMAAEVKGSRTAIEASVAAVLPRLAELETTLGGQLHEGNGRVTAEVEQRSAAVASQLTGQLEALIEELKKPKKGWFG